MNKAERDHVIAAIDWGVVLHVCRANLPAVDWLPPDSTKDPSVSGSYESSKFLLVPAETDDGVMWTATVTRATKHSTFEVRTAPRHSARQALVRLKTSQRSTRKGLGVAFGVQKLTCQEDGCESDSHARNWCKRHYNDWIAERKRQGLPSLNGTSIAGWSRDYESCVDPDCNSPHLRHKSEGRCTRCWSRGYQRQRRAEIKASEERVDE